jgi:uncharacterized protein YqeY
MTIKEHIDADIKKALLAGEKQLVTTLRGIKSALLYVEVAEGSRESGLSEEKVMQLLLKEAKKRQESADLYVKGGNSERAQQELDEKAVIEKYLPAQMSDEDIAKEVDVVLNSMPDATIKDMGRVIGAVKAKVGASADGSKVAELVKVRLS